MSTPVPRSDLETQIVTIATRPSRRLLITGDAGIGKTTLLDAGLAVLEQSGVKVLRATPSFAERSISYSLLWDLLAGLDWDRRAELRDDYREFLNIALGQAQSEATLPPLAVAVAVEELLAAASADRPLVFAIDDLQWADTESLTVLERALRRSESQPIYLIATCRPHADTHDAGQRLTFDDADTLTLAGLTVAELEDVARASWPSTITREQVEALHEHTAGNPMWALEMISQGRAAGLSALPVGTARAPMTLASAVASGLDALSADAQDVVSVVALVGKTRAETLLAVLGAEHTTDLAMGEAERAGFLAVTTEYLMVKHPLQASAAVARLEPARRRALHRSIASVIEDSDKRAQHLQQSRPPGVAEEIAVALSAASEATGKRGAPMRAAQFAAQSVLRTEPGTAAYEKRLLAQGHRLFIAGDWEAAAPVFARVDPAQLSLPDFDSYVSLSVNALAITTGNESASEYLKQLVETVRDEPLRVAVVEANMSEDDGVSEAERIRYAAISLKALEGHEAPNAIHRALGALVQAKVDNGSGLDEDMLAESERRETTAVVQGLNDTAQAQRGFYARDLDDVAGSRHALASLAVLARSLGEEGMERIFAVHGALTELVGGNRQKAEEFAAASGFTTEMAGLPPAVLAMLGQILVLDADWDELEAMIDLQGTSTVASAQYRALYIEGLRGLAASAREEWAPATVHLRNAVETADAMGLVELGRRFRVDLALTEALFQNGDVGEARERLAAIEEFLAHRQRPISLIGLHRMRSLDRAASGDIDGALAEVTTAIELARAADRPNDEARGLLQRGRVLKRLRKSAKARLDLTLAAEIAAATGDRALQQRVANTATTLRRAKSTDTLTPAEQRVLERIRLGESNREISQTLFISIRTVESHVASITRKTGAASRLKLISG